MCPGTEGVKSLGQQTDDVLTSNKHGFRREGRQGTMMQLLVPLALKKESVREWVGVPGVLEVDR